MKFFGFRSIKTTPEHRTRLPWRRPGVPVRAARKGHRLPTAWDDIGCVRRGRPDRYKNKRS